MSQAVTVRKRGMHENVTEPVLSKPLTAALFALRQEAERAIPSFDRVAVTPEVQTEARRILTNGREFLDRAGLDLATEWLRSLNFGTAAPLSVPDFDRRAAVVADTIMELPAAVFTAETSREARRVFKFFPSGQEAYDFLMPLGRRWMNLQAGLRSVMGIGSGQKPEPVSDRSETAQEYVQKLVQTMQAEMAAKAAASPQGKLAVKPRHLTPQELRAAHALLAAEGNAASATRVAMIDDHNKEQHQ